MKWSLVQRGLFFVCRGGPNAYIMQLKFMGWAYKKEAAAQFICATASLQRWSAHLWQNGMAEARSGIMNEG